MKLPTRLEADVKVGELVSLTQNARLTNAVPRNGRTVQYDAGAQFLVKAVAVSRGGTLTELTLSAPDGNLLISGKDQLPVKSELSHSSAL